MTKKKDIQELLDNSSLGSKPVKSLRRKTPISVVEEILAAAINRRGNSVPLDIETDKSLTTERRKSMSIEVKCINKSNRSSAHERITHIGGVNPDGTRWKLDQASAIVGIKSGKWSFYVSRPPGHKTDVIVAKSSLGTEYLKTKADGEQPNNLLSLPECP